MVNGCSRAFLFVIWECSEHVTKRETAGRLVHGGWTHWALLRGGETRLQAMSRPFCTCIKTLNSHPSTERRGASDPRMTPITNAAALHFCSASLRNEFASARREREERCPWLAHGAIYNEV